MLYQFEWDSDKAELNLANHDVSFEEAQSVFYDPLSLTTYDQSHSDDEIRYIDIGQSLNYRLLVVVYTERDTTIRIISARKATAHERRQYEQI